MQDHLLQQKQQHLRNSLEEGKSQIKKLNISYQMVNRNIIKNVSLMNTHFFQLIMKFTMTNAYKIARRKKFL
jgi:hypothetical protein